MISPTVLSNKWCLNVIEVPLGARALVIWHVNQWKQNGILLIHYSCNHPQLYNYGGTVFMFGVKKFDGQIWNYSSFELS